MIEAVETPVRVRTSEDVVHEGSRVGTRALARGRLPDAEWRTNDTLGDLQG